MIRAALLEAEGLDAVVVLRRVLRVDAIRQRLDQAEQGRVRAHVGGRVRRVVELDLGELRDLGEGRVGDRRGARLAVAGELHRTQDQRGRGPGGGAEYGRARG